MTLLVCSNLSLLSTKKATLPNGWLFLCTPPGAMMLIYDCITPFGFVIVVFSIFVQFFHHFCVWASLTVVIPLAVVQCPRSAGSGRVKSDQAGLPRKPLAGDRLGRFPQIKRADRVGAPRRVDGHGGLLPSLLQLIPAVPFGRFFVCRQDHHRIERFLQAALFYFAAFFAAHHALVPVD